MTTASCNGILKKHCMMKNEDKPLYSLTVGEYIELHKSLSRDLTVRQPNDDLKELLTIREAAELLYLSVPTLYTMNCKGQIPFTKVSGKVYYRRSALELWLESGERKTKVQLRREVEEGL